MKVILSQVKRQYPRNKADAKFDLERMERAGRTCWKSEDRIAEGTAEKFADFITNTKHHLSVLEHVIASYTITTNRGITHEIVRHRIGAYSQESTRFVNYHKRELRFLDPRPAFPIIDQNREMFAQWLSAMTTAEQNYNALLLMGAPPELARDALPHSTVAEIVVTYNLRQWLHFFSERCQKAAHPQMREIAFPILADLAELYPTVFKGPVQQFAQEIEEHSIIRSKFYV